MSYSRSQSRAVDLEVKQKASELNDLCRAAFLNFTDQLVLADISKKEEIKQKKKVQDDVNDNINLILRGKILAVDSELKNLTEHRNNIRGAIEKQLSNLPLSDEDEALLRKFGIDNAVLEQIKPEKVKLDLATKELFDLQVKPASFTKESAAARQTLSCYVSHEILTGNNDKEKAKIIDKWAQVMRQMLKEGNYYGAFVINTALRDDNIKNTQAMQLTSLKTQLLMKRAENIFTDSKKLKRHMEMNAWLKKPIIPSLHTIEGALVGCAEKIDYVNWNAQVERLQQQALRLKQEPAPDLSGEFTTSLLAGKISENVNLTLEKESKTDVSMINIMERERKHSVKAEGFNNLLSIKSNILSTLKALQAFVDNNKGEMNKQMQELIDVVIDAVKTFADLSNGQKQNEVKSKINDLLEQGKLTEKPRELISALGDLFEQLIRKMEYIKVKTQDVTAQAVPVKATAEMTPVADTPTIPPKPIYIGPRYVQSHLKQMQSIFNTSEDPYVREHATEINKAIDFMLIQRELRKHETLINPQYATKTEMTVYLQDMQYRKDELEDNLPEEIKQAGVLHQAIAVLKANGKDEQQVSKLIACFNHHLRTMALDAAIHPDDSLKDGVRILKIPRIVRDDVVVKPVKEAERTPHGSKVANKREIQRLEFERAAIIDAHHEREKDTTSKAAGKMEMSGLNEADLQRISAIDDRIHHLQAANYALRNNKKISDIPAAPEAKAAIPAMLPAAPKPEVTKSRNSTIIRMLDGVKTLFAKDKTPADGAKRRSALSKKTTGKDVDSDKQHTVDGVEVSSSKLKK